MTKHFLRAALVAFALLALAACGGDSLEDKFGDASTGGDSDLSDEERDIQEFNDAVAEVLGPQGGGGLLTFDGVEYPIDSVTCMAQGDRVDSGTFSAENGFRVFVSGFLDDLGPQILDPDGLQWFDGDRFNADTRDLVTFDGNTYTAPVNTWWNNLDDRVVEASFSYFCP